MSRLFILAALCSACSMTPAERAQYGLAAIKGTCAAYEKHSAEIPPDVKAELDAICPVIATAHQ